jgi:hypothetical protein
MAVGAMEVDGTTPGIEPFLGFTEDTVAALTLGSNGASGAGTPLNWAYALWRGVWEGPIAPWSTTVHRSHGHTEGTAPSNTRPPRALSRLPPRRA